MEAGMGRISAVQRTRRGLWLVAISLFVIALSQCVSVERASAHASLVHVEPADGAVIKEAPRSFALTFNEPTSPLVLKLVRPDGSSLVLDRFVLRDATLDIEAPSGLGNGTYVLSWRVISEDGHPVGGSAVFSIGAPSAAATPVAMETVDWPVRIAIWSAKAALYMGLFIGVGGASFATWVGGRSRAASRIASWAMLVGLAAATISVGLQGLDALGVSLPQIMQRTVWTTGLSTSYGATVLIAVLALGSGLVALRLKAGAARVLALLGLTGVAVALAASGHASAAHPQWLTRPAVFLHAIGIAFWTGSLVPLGAALARRTPDATAVLHRFSRAIAYAIAPLVAAGVLLAVVQLRSLDALWTTAYGQILSVKLVLLAALFALAFVNRYRLTKPAERGDADAVLRLQRSIRLELVLVLAIFAVAAVWRFTPPPRALAEAAAAPASLHIHAQKAMADLTVTPGRAGPAEASIAIMTGDFGPLDAKEVTLVLSNPGAGIEQIKRPAHKASDGTWQVDDLNLPLPGRWSVRIEILVSDFELVRLEGNIEIRR
jgi:copper transport protein